MGERQAPPVAALNEPDKVQSSAPPTALLEGAQYRWPPSGWPIFSCVTKDSGSAFKTESGHGTTVLKYTLTCENDIYALEIMSGQIARHGGDVRFEPAIGIRFAAREDWFDDNPQKAVMDIHVRGQRLLPERGAVLRVILAMTFMISRIDRGLAPSLGRVLKLYKLA